MVTGDTPRQKLVQRLPLASSDTPQQLPAIAWRSLDSHSVLIVTASMVVHCHSHVLHAIAVPPVGKAALDGSCDTPQGSVSCCFGPCYRSQVGGGLAPAAPEVRLRHCCLPRMEDRPYTQAEVGELCRWIDAGACLQCMLGELCDAVTRRSVRRYAFAG